VQNTLRVIPMCLSDIFRNSRKGQKMVDKSYFEQNPQNLDPPVKKYMKFGKQNKQMRFGFRFHD